MASALDSGLRSPGWSPGRVIMFVLGQDTLLSQCLSPPGELSGKADEMLGDGGGGW